MVSQPINAGGSGFKNPTFPVFAKLLSGQGGTPVDSICRCLPSGMRRLYQPSPITPGREQLPGRPVPAGDVAQANPFFCHPERARVEPSTYKGSTEGAQVHAIRRTLAG